MPNQDSKRVHCFVSGRVQGVWYRKSAQQTAQSLGLSGWVRNLDDGRVEFVAEGTADKVDALLAWAAEGPPGAQVGNVATEAEDPTGRNGDFDVLY